MKRAGAMAMVVALGCAGCHHAAPGKGGSDGGAGTSGDLSCAGVQAKAKLVPVDLVVLVDRSGSLGDGVNGDPALKWNPLVAGMNAFFADAQSAGMAASLQFFTNPNAASSIDECNPGEYFTPAVAMTALPDPSSFSKAFAAVTPQGNTPTLPALQGSINYAQQQQQLSPGLHTAIVLVTDGEPDYCDSSVNDVALQAAKVAATLPTYVIGVGTTGADAMALDQIAASGGTTRSIPVSVGDPAKTTTDIETALQQIRGLILACDFPVPAAPKGMTIDFARVNVDYTPSTGALQSLSYDNNCAKGTGWVYDNPQAPTKVQLCPSTCQTVRQDHGGQIDVIFGCRTMGDLIQ